MKVYLRDKRANPGVVYIDGKRYVLPSNREILKDISKSAFINLSSMSCISIRLYEEIKQDIDIKPEIKEQYKETEKKEEPKDDLEVNVSELVVEDKLEDSSILPSVEEQPKQEDVVENKEEAQVEDKPEEINKEEPKKDYSSLTKKELKALVEEKGGDPSGMTKSNLVDWLNSNA